MAIATQPIESVYKLNLLSPEYTSSAVLVVWNGCLNIWIRWLVSLKKTILREIDTSKKDDINKVIFLILISIRRKIEENSIIKILYRITDIYQN